MTQEVRGTVQILFGVVLLIIAGSSVTHNDVNDLGSWMMVIGLSLTGVALALLGYSNLIESQE
jgi:high-affinity nickel permease